MKRILMIVFFLNTVLFVTLLNILFGSRAFAAVEYRANIDITGTVWTNALNVDVSAKVPAEWSQASRLGLPTVNHWVPGTFVAAPPTNVRFSGTVTGRYWESANVPIGVVGVQYNTTGISNSISNSGLGHACLKDSISGSMIDMRGANCMSASKISNAASTIPFILYRPIIDIQDAYIQKALDGQPKGVYTAFLPISIKVNYYVGNVLTHRIINETISIIINYDPVWITSVHLSNKNVDITTVYDSTSRTVDGVPEDVSVSVAGYFDNGIRLSISNRKYSLNHESVSGPNIPYYIQCIRCGSKLTETIEMVDKIGEVKNDNVLIGSDPAKNITFVLRFGYSNVDGTTLISGKYNDIVDVTIEPVI
ncbi:hypothetical protein [Vibrio crassostreae]|uniref:hypothetical protein n=1 Tax=Vibrio crassostreae TaxID=246167 RepID=UPI0040692B4E